MDILNTLKKVAAELDELGYFDQADEIDDMIEAVAGANALSKKAAGEYGGYSMDEAGAKVSPAQPGGHQLLIKVQEIPPKPDGTGNEWLASSNVVDFPSISMPIYQSEELKVAQNKAPGIQAMRAALHQEVRKYLKSHHGFSAIIQDPRFK